MAVPHLQPGELVHARASDGRAVDPESARPGPVHSLLDHRRGDRGQLDVLGLTDGAEPIEGFFGIVSEASLVQPKSKDNGYRDQRTSSTG